MNYRILLPLMIFLGAFFTLFAASFADHFSPSAAGDLDPEFGFSGKVVTAMPGTFTEQAQGVEVQPDGKIIAVGSRVIQGMGTSDSVIVRYNLDGSLDAPFGTDGILIVPVHASQNDGATSVRVQPDGKILVAGTVQSDASTGSDFYVLRFNSDGTPDESFGTLGKTVVDFSSLTDIANAMRIQPDGKILVGGRSTSTGTFYDFALIRLSSGGALDGSFGTGGKVTTPGLTNDDEIWDLGLYADGRIVAGGTADSGGSRNFFAARYNANGTLDTSFDGDGKAITSGGAGRGLAVYADGKIIVAGYGFNGSEDFAAVRFNADGSLDTTWDSDGKVFVTVGPHSDNAYGAVALADGKLAIVGQTDNGTGARKWAIVRLNSDGTLDTNFNGTGIVQAGFGPLADTALCATVMADGRLVVAGYRGYGVISYDDFAVARFLTNGKPDPSFGFPGRATASFFGGQDSAEAIALQRDGKIVLVGSAKGGSFDDFAIARFNPDGVLDFSFGQSGRLSLSNSLQDDVAYGAAVQPDGKIIAVGFAGTPPASDMVIARHLSNGQPDFDFGDFGTKIFPVGTGADFAYDVAVQADGKIVIAGLAIINASSDFAIVRLNSNGSFDSSFGGGDGIVTTPVSPGTDVATALKLQSDGKIVAAGSASPSGPNRDFAVVRYNADGSLDGSFGTGGIAITSVTNGSDEANGLAIQTDGKIVLAGTTTEDYAVVRYNANGTLDSSFDGDGIVITGVAANTNDTAKDVVVQPNSKIVIAGPTVFPGSEFNVGVVRYNSDGSLDGTFGSGGIVVQNYGLSGESVAALALQPDGKLVTAGGINFGATRREFMLLRFLGDSVSGPRAPFDFDGDGKTDIGIFRPSVAEWWINRSSNGSTFAAQFGATTDKITPGDFTGDAKADIAFWQPASGEWYVLRSEDFSFFSFPFGSNGDVPVPADYDNDNKADAAVFRPASSTWFIRRSSDGGTTIQTFGTTGDIPVPADYDGDGKADIAIYRPSLGQWWMDRSTAGVLAVTFGVSTDKPVQGDYTGDGKSDVAFWRPSTGEWFILRSQDFSFFSFPFGTSTDVPSPGDYDGDGKYDATVFRPSTNTWFSQRTTAGTLIQTFGTTGDKPIPNAFVP